ncbi:MAG TPA: sigma 54-interacting transcriptional regulator [Polyangia bacterium]|jgi:transcriptional regulator with GAF, ATPase, and Fis domain
MQRSAEAAGDEHVTPSNTTQAVGGLDPGGGDAAVRRFHLTVLEGAAAQTWDSAGDACSIGSHPSNDLIVDNPTVSRFHCEVRLDTRGARLRDLDSRNGTMLDGIPVSDAFLRGGSLVRIGRAVVRFQFGTERNRIPISQQSRFGSLVGESTAMRQTFALLECASKSDATVLLEGETGTGKEGAAGSIHRASARRDRPFVVIDCSAIPENLLESELFGHERGSFTGAVGRRVGAFEEANGGTIFLDEIGELPPDLQPKLLRVLEQREIRRVGGNGTLPVNVRVIAATNRDLRAEVNAGRFRSDLYFRLAVVKIPLPPLRTRPDDIPLLVDSMLESLHADPTVARSLLSESFLSNLQRAVWPGNVRELRNYLERCLVFQEPLAMNEGNAPEASGAVDVSVAFSLARRQALEEFERRYVIALLRAHRGKVSQAARAAEIDRVYLYRLMRRHAIKA